MPLYPPAHYLSEPVYLGMRILLSIIAAIVISFTVQAQELLPDFTLETLPGRGYRISWQNPFGKNLKQLSVQRAAGNKTGFTTIFSTNSPQLPENGFIDRPPALFKKYYYRIFYVLNGEQYFFTTPKVALHQVFEPDRKGMMRVWMNDQLISTIPDHKFKRWKDSVSRNPRLEIVAKGPGEIILIDQNDVAVNNPSGKISINHDGAVEIRLGSAVTDYRYRLLFKDKKGLIILQLDTITEPLLVLEKSNFLQAGYFQYELYENGHLIEKNTINIR
jgi:hypothetical protein